VCANSKMSAQGAPGCARGLKKDVVTREQELARLRCAWRHGEARVAAGTACRAWKKAAERTKAVAGQRATRGVCREQEVALAGLQRRRATAKSGSGRWPGGVARRGEASAARGNSGAGLRRHVARL
jgi:hypothetical protein